MEKIKETFNQYKWVLLTGIIVAILIAVITANMHVLQFMSYKMQNNTEGIITVLNNHVQNKEEQNDWFFVQGIDYLVSEEVYTDEIQSFFETNFEFLSSERQKQIIKGYNDQKLSLPMNEGLMNMLVGQIDDDTIKAYIKRMEPNEFEQGLVYVYGKEPKVDEGLVSGLYKLLSVYPSNLPFDKFKFNLYDLLVYNGEDAETQKKTILSKISSEVAKENIFGELKVKPITEEQLNKWIEFFNETHIISNADYVAYKDAYGEICLIRNQYKELDAKQIDLQNKKDAVELKISESSKKLEAKQTEISSKQKEVSELESKINDLTNYTHMALFVEKESGTGSNDYIASIPRNSLFGYRPSNQKFIIKLQDSSLANEGVQYLDLYFKGSKKSASGDEYTYYEEVSKSALANISSLESERTTKLNNIESLKKEAAVFENEISNIKKENDYDNNEQALMNIAVERDELSNKLSEKAISIKELFGLKDLQISLKG